MRRGRITQFRLSPFRKFVARFQNGSDELTKLKAQTTGTAVITLTYGANNSLAVTFQKVGFSLWTSAIRTGVLRCRWSPRRNST